MFLIKMMVCEWTGSNAGLFFMLFELYFCIICTQQSCSFSAAANVVSHNSCVCELLKMQSSRNRHITSLEGSQMVYKLSPFPTTPYTEQKK